MNATRQTITAIIAGLLLAHGAWTSVSAKDTDIYLKTSMVARDDSPNVLIIFDNSGSMQSNSITTRPAFDATVDYCTLAGNPGIPCDRVYWSFTGSPPSQGSSQWFAASKNNCEDSKPILTNNGFYAGTKIAGFKPSGPGKGWKTLSGQNDSNLSYVDCQKDNGATDPKGYVRRSDLNPLTAYTSTAAEEFNWASFSTNATPTLYSAQYMNYWYNTTLTVTKTRLQIAKDAIKSVIDANRTVRFGLMVFNNNGDDSNGPHGGRVVMKVDTMDDTRRTAMKNLIDSLAGNTWTPLAETMWEARQYYGGLAVDYGNDDAAASPARDTTAESGANYISPFKYGCQKSYIVYMTDGDPTKDDNADGKIKGLSGLGSSSCAFSSDAKTSCLKDLAKWMYQNDVLGALTGNQTIVTYTIGFGSGISADGKALLQQTAINGGGKYYAAEDADQLTSAFQSALTEILQTNTSFASPSLSINAFNRLFNRDDIYFALFKPSSSMGWDGNVKKFRLCNTNDVATYGCKFGDVIDTNGAGAIDINSKIKDSAVSYWSASADGAEVTKGGAGAQVPAASARSLYTYRGSYAGLSASSPATSIEVKAVSGNPLYDAAINDPTILGLPDTSGSPTTTNATDTAEVTKLINWMRGEDSYDKNGNGSTTDARWAFADPIHSRPLAVTYGAVWSGGKPDPNKPITKIFIGTNDGAIRIINNDTGKEEWAFIPKEFLKDQYNLAQDADGEHIYGIDGSPSFWVIDVDNDGIIEPNDGDRVYMYVGLRRNVSAPNVRNIYAFDATPAAVMTATTDVVAPKLMWVIEGGSGNFTRLGQTWSKPLPVRVRFKCPPSTGCDDGNPATTDDSESKMVLMFAGGYDPNQDNAIPAGTDAMGNAIYMVDLRTGSRIWWASSDTTATLVLPQMKYSIPSDLSFVDTNSDGSVDRIYVGDTGGQVWRIDLGDLIDTNSNGGSAGYVFADLGCSGGSRTDDCAATAIQHRRKFFNPPAVAKVNDPNFSTEQYYDLVTLVSGDREDPLDLLTTNKTPVQEAVHNRIYALRDINYKKGPPPSPPGVPSPLTDADLHNATAASLDTLTGTALTTAQGQKGWFIDLVETTAVKLPNGLTTTWIGEKGLSRPVIFGGILFVTTFIPANDASAQQTCVASEGTAKAYALDYLTSAAEFDFNNDGTKERSITIGGGIPSEVVIVIRPGGVTAGVGVPGGMASVPAPPVQPWVRTFWYDE